LTSPASQPGAAEREVRIPLGELCRSALASDPDTPLDALGQLFDQHYGDDGPGFFELCVVQHDLAGDLNTWHRVAEGRVVAVVRIIADVLPPAADGQTFVVEGDDLSALPDEIKPLAEQERHRRVTGELPRLRATGELPPAPPIPLWEADRRQALTAGIVAIGLLAAATVWFFGALLGFLPFPFAK
jgi:hypothetical protein